MAWLQTYINGQLENWANRLELTTDSSKVDSGVENFPVMVNISNSSGYNNTDTTHVIEHLKEYPKNVISDLTHRYTMDSVSGNIIYDDPVSVSGINATYRASYDSFQLSVNINNISYDSAHAYGCCVLKESDGTYKMWYSGHNGSNYRILYCTSTNGINWSNFQLAVNIGNISYDSTQVYAPCVIKESDGTYKMWYNGSNGSNYRILYCTSTNGINWSNFQLVVNIGNTAYDTSQIYEAAVIKESDGTYKMWYTGSNGSNYRILYCTSTNGINWSNFQLSVNINNISYDSSHAYAPCVIKESDGTYKMWYSGSNGPFRTIYCTSTNGINWSNFQMVVNVGNTVYDTSQTYRPYVLKESDGTYKMWYTGITSSNYRIIYYSSGSTNAITSGYIDNCLNGCMGLNSQLEYTSASFRFKRSSTYSNTAFFQSNNWRNGIGVRSTSAGNYLYTSYSGTVYNTNLTISDTSWHHIAIVEESDNSVRLYLDGTAASAVAPAETITNSVGDSFYITSSNSPSYFDQVNFFDKQLSQSEVTALYSQPDYRYQIAVTAPSSFSEADTSWSTGKAYHEYTMDSISGNIIYDDPVSVSGINATYRVSYDSFQLSVNINNISYDTLRAYTPCVLKESDGTYKMWYSGFNGSNFRILYCTSTNGINWSNFQLVVNIGNTAYDGDAVYAPYVLKESDGTYKMWYTGSNGSNYRILYCTSTNGINWSNFQLSVNINNISYDSTFAYIPCVIKESDGTYKMWYSGYNGTNVRIIYCTSVNGIAWSAFQLAVNINNISYDSNFAYAPCVLKESDGTYKMWYSGNNGSNDRILYCTSTNGINWSNFQLAVSIGNTTYDTSAAYHSCVLKESDGTYKMWYSGFNGTNARIIYYSSGSTNAITSGYIDNCLNGCMGLNSQLEYTSASFRFKRSSTYSNTAFFQSDNWRNGIGVRSTSAGNYLYTSYSGTVYNTNLTISDTSWHHIAIVEESDNSVRLYLDGTAASAVAPAETITNSIGDSYYVTSTNSPSYFDQVRFFNETLSTDDITALGSVEATYTETYCEISEFTDSVIKLWTKLPFVSSLQDTLFYLYYDNRASGNTTYVGLTGSTQAKQVWDSNYSMVLHMDAMDNSPTNNVIDSTTNTNNFTLSNVSKISDGYTYSVNASQIYKSGTVFNQSSGTVEVVCSHTNLNSTQGTLYSTSIDSSNKRHDLNITTTGQLEIEEVGGTISVSTENGYADGVERYYAFMWGSVLGRRAFANDTKLTLSNASSSFSYAAPTYRDIVGNNISGISATSNMNIEGNIKEVRVSNIDRTDSWVRVSNYSIQDELLSFNKPAYKVSGYVYSHGVPVVRTIRLYHDSTGILVDETTSNSSGYYELFTSFDGYHYAVCLDPPGGEDLNYLILKNVELESL